MTVNDPGKLALLGIALVGGLILAAIDSQSIGSYVVVAVLGYLTGNGRLAARKEPPSTALSPTMAPMEVAQVIDGLRAHARWQAKADALAVNPRGGGRVVDVTDDEEEPSKGRRR